jgi:hypothetical protein
MKVFGRPLAIAALLSLGLGAASAALADTAQEVYMCKLNEGKTMADLKKVITDFNQMIAKLKGGDKYRAWLLTPVAAADLADIVWVGEMPDETSLAALNADYRTSEAGRAQEQKFSSVITCKSRSIWNSEKVK